MKVGVIAWIMGNQAVAFCLIPAIIWYEKYGEDPMKRTILNQLFASSMFLVLGYNLIPSNFFLVRLFTGRPINYQFTFVFFFVIKSIISFMGLLAIGEYKVYIGLKSSAAKRKIALEQVV